MSDNAIQNNMVESIVKELGGLTLKVVGPHLFTKYGGSGKGASEFIGQFKPYWKDWTEDDVWAHLENNLEGKALNWFKGSKGKLFKTRAEFEIEFLEMYQLEKFSGNEKFLFKIRGMKFIPGKLEEDLSEIYSFNTNGICMKEIITIVTYDLPLVYRTRLIDVGTWKELLMKARIIDLEKESNSNVAVPLGEKQTTQLPGEPRGDAVKSGKGFIKKSIVCYTCGGNHYANKCSKRKISSQRTRNDVLAIEEAEVEKNKDDEFYFSFNNLSFKVNPIFDSGAEDCYISSRLVTKLGKQSVKLENAEKRFTCLKEPFFIEEEVVMEGRYKGKVYVLKCKVLPKRTDDILILGRCWLREFKERKLMQESLKVECEIKTAEGERVVECPRRFPQSIEQALEEQVKGLIEKGYIKLSNSSWMNNILAVEKPDKSLRIVCNFVALNKLVELDRYSLPLIEEVIFGLKDQVYFTKIDLKEGFFQIKLKKEDSHKTAFRVKNRLYEWTVMPMGFKNSPAVFQRHMDKVLDGLIGTKCYVYVDDVLIFGKSEQEHEDNLKEVLGRLNEAGLRINEAKTVSKVQELQFLGHEIGFNTVKPIIDKVQGIQDYERPKDKSDILRFMGLINYYRKFIPNCSSKAEPLVKLTRKDVDYVWGMEQEKAFQNLKCDLMSPRTLTQPDFKKKFILETDASMFGLGAILSQEQQGNLVPVVFTSRTLKNAEINYSISEKEMLGALWAMESLGYYLYGREFDLITDHKALEALNTKGVVQSARIERWMWRISAFNFNVTYKKGTLIEHVDALSRSRNEDEDEIMVLAIQDDISAAERIVGLHVELLHRGEKAVQQRYQDKFKEIVPVEQIREVLKNCMVCKLYNPLKTRGYKKVEAYEVGEKVAIDIMEPIRGQYIITGIDYFTRTGFAKAIPDKRTGQIIAFIKEIKEKIPIIKTIICDEARENISKEVTEWLSNESIKLHVTSPYHHQSNGRIERFNRTMLDALNKCGLPGLLANRIKHIVVKYNDTYHSVIKMKPNEAIDPEKWECLRQTQYEARLKKNKEIYNQGNWKQLEIGDNVLIKNEVRENKRAPRFQVKGIVVEARDFNTYLLKNEKGKLIKRHISQLKKY